MRLDLAFKAFFRRVKRGAKPGYPRFKGHGQLNSLTYPQNGFIFTDDHKKIKLSKIGLIKIIYHRPIQGKIKTCRIIKKSSNKYFISFTVEIEPKQLPKTYENVGIDCGLKTFLTLSNEKTYENHRFFKRSQNKLAKAQKKLQKLKDNKNNHIKQKVIIAKIYEKIANQRADLAHKTSQDLAKKYNTICFEKLEIDTMNSFRPINKAIRDVAWNQLIRYTSYKAANAGRKVILVDPAYTSQTCSKCGCIHNLTLKDRTMECNCKLKMDRDLNASINILRLGLQSLDKLKT